MRFSRRLAAPAPPLDTLGAGALAALLAGLLAPPLVAYEPAWEVAAALGYAACAALVLCCRAAPAVPGRLTARRFALHRAAGHAAVALVAAHVAVMAAADPFVLDYLGWQAPGHVLFGMLGALALAASVLTREPASPARLRRAGRRWLHAALGLAAVAGTLGHLWAATAKPAGSAWRFALVAGALAVPALPPLARLLGARRPPGLEGEPTAARAGEARALLALLGAVGAALVAVPALAAFLRG